MDQPHDPDTIVWARTPPVQPPRESADAGWPSAPGPLGGPAGGTDDDPPAEPGPSARAPKRRHFWRELLVIVIVAALLTLVVKAFVVQVYRIPSASMENTLQVGDRVLVNKLVYHTRSIARGDVVVISGQDSWGPDTSPSSGDPIVRVWDGLLADIGLSSSQTYYIKRVIGLPGDKVACCTAGKVTVNGVPLSEGSYLYPGDAPSFPFKTVTVPQGHLWVMGDHRGDSDDSRYHTGDPGGGAIPESEVVGRAFLVIWPLSRISDLPIPSTFSQAALHSGAAGAAVLGASGTALAAMAAVPVAGAAAGAGLLGAPLLLLRRRREARRSGQRTSSQRSHGLGPRRRGRCHG